MAKWRDTALIKGCVACQRDQRAERRVKPYFKAAILFTLARIYGFRTRSRTPDTAHAREGTGHGRLTKLEYTIVRR